MSMLMMRYWSSLLCIVVFAQLALGQEEYKENQIVCRAVNGERIHGMRTLSVDNASVEQLSNKIRVVKISGASNRIASVDQTILNKAAALEKKNERLGVHVRCNPDVIMHTDQTPNDYAIDPMNPLWGLTRIGAPTAWETTTGSASVKVAIIDTGIQYTHPDLSANMSVNSGEIAGNSIDDDANGYVDDVYGYDFANNDGNPMDDNQHGSHCAGTIGARGNNGVGLVGVNWTVSLIAVKVLGASGSGSLSSVAAGVDYARIRGAHVMSLSLGGSGGFSVLQEALTAASNAGAFISIAAGNSHANNDSIPTYPAEYAAALNSAVAVAAIDSNGARASFSNYGATKVHLGAPGVGIYSTVITNSYASFSGTSMATPHVAGVAALLKAANSSLTGAQIKTCILNSVQANSALTGLVSTGGELNVANAMALCGSGTPAPSDPTPVPTATPTPNPSDPGSDPLDPNPEPSAALSASINSMKFKGSSELAIKIKGDVTITIDNVVYVIEDSPVSADCSVKLPRGLGKVSKRKDNFTDQDGRYSLNLSLSSKKIRALRRGDKITVQCQVESDDVDNATVLQQTYKLSKG